MVIENTEIPETMKTTWKPTKTLTTSEVLSSLGIDDETFKAITESMNVQPAKQTPHGSLWHRADVQRMRRHIEAGKAD